MTDIPAATGRATRRPERLGWRGRLVLTLGLWAALLAGLALMLPGQFSDPYIRSDDYPAQLPDAPLYYYKTLTEGRWLNWLWMLRSWPTDPVVLQWIYAGAWTLTAALVGAGLAQGWRQAPLAALIALAFAMTPPQAYIGLWYNTTIPITLLMAGFAALAVFAPARVTTWAVLPAVPVMLMAQSAYPFFALAFAAALPQHPPGRGPLLRVCGLFLAGLVLGLLAIYTINWAVHGHFGILMLGWREPNPLEGWGDLVENLGTAFDSLSFALLGLAVKPSPITLLLGLLMVLTALVALVADPRRAERALAALAIGMAVPAAHMVLTGVEWPYRVMAHVHAGVILLAGVALARARGAAWRLPVAALLVVTVLIALLVWKQLQAGRALVYQETTRALAAEVAEAAGTEAATELVIVGQAHGLPGSGFLQFALGLRHRMEQLTGLDAHLCSPQAGDYVRAPTEAAPALLARLAELRRPEAEVAEADARHCARHGAAVAALPPWPRPGHAARVAPGAIGLRLPERTTADHGP